MHIVMLNGAAGSGKTYFAEELRNALTAEIRRRRLLPDAGVARVLKCGFKEPLRDMLFQFAESAGFIEYGYRTDERYAALKDKVMHNRTGRAWQILWGQAMRDTDVDIMSKILLSKLYSIEPMFAIVDDLGFPHENSFVRMMAIQSHFTVSAIHLDRRTNHKYSHGDQYQDDSRFCLRDSCDLDNPRLEAAVGYAMGKITQAA